MTWPTHNTSLAVKRAVQNIHSDDMLGLVVPRAVLAPVVCGDLFPRVVVLVACGEELHLDMKLRMYWGSRAVCRHRR
jgi:hypothetical protein